VIRIGPITIMSTKTRDAYRNLVNRSYELHQVVWYSELPMEPIVQRTIKDLDAAVSEAISHVPAQDVDSLE
jgi:hypothetical protein